MPSAEGQGGRVNREPLLLVTLGDQPTGTGNPFNFVFFGCVVGMWDPSSLTRD